MAKILIVDSDTATRRALARQLKSAGHTVVDASNPGLDLATLHQAQPDLVLCDIEAAGRRGLALVSDLRRSEKLKAIRVLAMTSSTAARAVFDAGVDELICKPVNADELKARIHACLRRPPVYLQTETISSGGITIDNVAKRLKVDGRYLAIAPREYRLLLFFLNHQDQVFTREQLLASVWAHDVSVGARTVDVHIRRLRSLLEPSGYDGYLQTVRGSGYRYSLTP